MKKITLLLVFFSFILTLTFFLGQPVQAGWLQGLNLVASNSGLPINFVHSVIINVVNWIFYIFLFLALISFVISAIMFIFSGGNQDLAIKARRAFIFSIIGVAIGLAGIIIINFIMNMYAGTGEFAPTLAPTRTVTQATRIQPLVSQENSLFSFLPSLSAIPIPPNTGLPMPVDITGGAGPVADVLLFTMMWLLRIFLFLAVISFAVTGIMYFLASGKGDSTNAKKAFQYSIIAVAVVAGSYVIILTIDYLLR